MSIKGIINNIESKGIQETYKLYLCKKYKLVTQEKSNSIDEKIVASIVLGLIQGSQNKSKISVAERKITAAAIMKGIMEANGFEEESVKKIDVILEEMSQGDYTDDDIRHWDAEMIALETPRYKSLLKKLFIKEIIPNTYNKYSGAPVEEKVIIMESGNAPSSSSKHLGKELQRQGKYQVVYTGLKIRQISSAEFYMNAVSFIRDLATAKALFMSTANDLLSCIDVRPETQIIQLWHGVGAFKHVGKSNADNPHFGRSRKQWEEYDSYRNYTCVTIAGEGQRWIFEEAMGLTPEQILPIGISRTDIFFDDAKKEGALNKLYKAFPQIKGKKIVLYAPTFRGDVAKAAAPDQLDVLKLKEGISDEYVLLIKHHGLSKNIPPIQEGLENIFAFDMNSNKVLDIEQLLLISDILITDYSSVAFEFAITERPIAFFTYDLEDYIEKRGLYFDFYTEAPGPVCKSTDELVDYISTIDDSFDRDKIMAFKEKYVSACDGHATERTIALIDTGNPQ